MHLTVVLLVSLVLPCPTITATNSTSRSCLVCTSCRQPSPHWCGTVWYFCAKACTRAVLCALPLPFQTTTPMGTARWVTCHYLPGESPFCARWVTCLCLCLVSHLSVSVPGESTVSVWWVTVFVSVWWVTVFVCLWWVTVFVSVWWVTCLCLSLVSKCRCLCLVSHLSLSLPNDTVSHLCLCLVLSRHNKVW